MEQPSPAGEAESEPPTPEILLDALRQHPEWSASERVAQLDRLITGFPSARLLASIRARLGDLGGPDAEIMLRILEGYGSPDDLRALADALRNQPGLAADRAWEALALLADAGLLEEYRELSERWDELEEGLDEEATLAQLAEQLEEGPEEVALALEGLEAVEPEVRCAIVAGLARLPLGPGLIEFLRLLAFAHDLPTRSAALDVLAGHSVDEPGLEAVWNSIATDHPDPEISALARGKLGLVTAIVQGSLARTAARLDRTLVTDLDGAGRGAIVISSRRGPEPATAAFACDLSVGIRGVQGDRTAGGGTLHDDLEHWAERSGRAVVRDVPELAVGLLAGCLGLCGPETPLAVRYWIEATVGPDFRPRPFPAPFPGWDPSTIPFEEMSQRAREVFAACPEWRDESPLTSELAREITLRESGAPPDPQRDAGAYRYLFEHRLRDQLEQYRRRLFWMASFWEAAGQIELARSALALAWQLSDAQHVVPSHPFTVALTTLSLTAAQEHLRRGETSLAP
jgi:hypothetical protein